VIKQCREKIQDAGFWVVADDVYFADAKVRIDLVAHNKHDLAFFCKYISPDSEKSLKHALCDAFLISIEAGFPFIFLSQNPLDSDCIEMLSVAGRNIVTDVIALTNRRDIDRLKFFARATEKELQAWVKRDFAFFDIENELPLFKSAPTALS
tara:strand:+ start:9128 stop:9583 length:456 start_codon:yes stop_codon:yes gene_type:complete